MSKTPSKEVAAGINEKIRVFFPLELRKDHKPRVRQKPVFVTLNGGTVAIPRGVIAIAPRWVQIICDKTGIYECFVSNQKVK